VPRPIRASTEGDKMANVKLHLGAARRRLTGFLNIDREYSEGLDLVADVSDLSAFQSNSVNEIYSSHTLEYFDREEVISVLSEWNRVLAPEGKVFVSVPDLPKLIEIYLSSNEIGRVLGPLFGKWKNPANAETLYHKTVWDFASLSSAFEHVGFNKVSTFNPVEYLGSIDPEFDDYSLAFYPHMDPSGIQVSLCIQAEKGAPAEANNS